MNRSKCNVCGKVRDQKYMKKQNELSGGSVWVCHRSVAYSNTVVKIGEVCYGYSPCELSFFKSQHNSLLRQNEIYRKSIADHFVFKRVVRDIYVSPELTFFLQ